MKDKERSLINCPVCNIPVIMIGTSKAKEEGYEVLHDDVKENHMVKFPNSKT